MESAQEVMIVKKQSLCEHKLIIPKEVEDKIRFICQKVWNTEWSGVLFYTYEGTFEEGLTITCKDIYVMDIGNATYTEFTMSPDVVSYMAENRELLDCQQALIHSHCTFSTFFSGTDINTLKEEGLERNNFVSLIVNNAGDYTAAITRKVKKNITESCSYQFFDKGEINSNSAINKEVYEIEYYDLTIEKEQSENHYSYIEDRLNEIKDSKSKDASTNNIVSNNYNTFSSYKPYKQQQPSLFEEYGKLDLNSINKDSYFDELPYDTFQVNKETLRVMVLQIITGSIVVNSGSKLEPSKWVNSMVNLFNKRFNNDMSCFKDWAELYIEFILSWINDNKLTSFGYGITEIQAIYADKLIKELKKLPTNIYLQGYVKALERYLE